MIVEFKDARTRKNLEDPKFLNKKYGSVITKRFNEFLKDAWEADNLLEFIYSNRGMEISTIKGNNNNIWKARLNNKYRVEFIVKDGTIQIKEIKEIIISKIHPHKYRK